MLALIGSAVLICFLVGLALVMQPTPAIKWLQACMPNILFFKPTEELSVALTLDDGPHKNITPEILDILKENECKATWFIIGSNMDCCPDLVARMHMEGHEVANHTMYDVASWRLSMEALQDQLLAVDRKLKNLFRTSTDGRRIKWFRPGHGLCTRQMLSLIKSHGYMLALGSLFPVDTWFTNQGNLIAKYLLWRIYPGAIIILHDREPQKHQTIQILKKLLPGLKQRGYSVVTLSSLVGFCKQS